MEMPRCVTTTSGLGIEGIPKRPPTAAQEPGWMSVRSAVFGCNIGKEPAQPGDSMERKPEHRRDEKFSVWAGRFSRSHAFDAPVFRLLD